MSTDPEFLKRRNQKNWVVLAVIVGLAAVVFAVTILKMKAGG